MPPTLRLCHTCHARGRAPLAAGVHPKVASEWLGHASATLTLDTYTHSVLRLDADAGRRMRRVLKGDGHAPGAEKDTRSGAVPAHWASSGL